MIISREQDLVAIKAKTKHRKGHKLWDMAKGQSRSVKLTRY